MGVLALAVWPAPNSDAHGTKREFGNVIANGGASAHVGSPEFTLLVLQANRNAIETALNEGCLREVEKRAGRFDSLGRRLRSRFFDQPKRSVVDSTTRDLAKTARALRRAASLRDLALARREFRKIDRLLKLIEDRYRGDFE